MLEISALMNWLKYFFLYNSISKENIEKLNQESMVAASEKGGCNRRGGGGDKRMRIRILQYWLENGGSLIAALPARLDLLVER